MDGLMPTPSTEATTTLIAATCLLIAIARLNLPFAHRPTGPTVRVVRLGLLPRVRFHAPVIVPFLVISLVGSIMGWWSATVDLLSLMVLIAILMLPMAYTVSDQGLMLGRRRPRRWTEFAGVRRRSGRVWLQPLAGGQGMDFWLPLDHDDDELVASLRRRMRECHRGAFTADPVDTPVGPRTGTVWQS